MQLRLLPQDAPLSDGLAPWLVSRGGVLSGATRENDDILNAAAARALISKPAFFRFGHGDAQLFGSFERVDLASTDTILICSLVERAKPRIPRQAALSAWFRLSAAEAATALDLAAGISISRIAKSRGLSQLTVRTHLRSVFEKTQAHSQRELVSLLIRLAAL